MEGFVRDIYNCSQYPPSTIQYMLSYTQLYEMKMKDGDLYYKIVVDLMTEKMDSIIHNIQKKEYSTRELVYLVDHLYKQFTAKTSLLAYLSVVFDIDQIKDMRKEIKEKRDKELTKLQKELVKRLTVRLDDVAIHKIMNLL
jgi:hypothetical protein